MTVDSSTIDSMTITHGSPFSPTLAIAEAYADKERNSIQIREGARDIVLHHEMTHILSKGLYFTFDEGATDLVTAEIYNRSYPDREKFDPRSSVYSDQVAAYPCTIRVISTAHPK